MLRIDGRLENAELPLGTRHPPILPSKHALTRLIVLYEHVWAGHTGPSYTLMRTRQQFWIIHGISSVQSILSKCSKCARRKATPICQLIADLPACSVTDTYNPFKFCGIDYFGPYTYRKNRSDRKAWGVLFMCLSTRGLHVKLVTSLDLTSFLLAFSRFTNLRGAVDSVVSDNGSTFCASAERLQSLLTSTEFHNSLRRSGINWIKFPPYAPSQEGTWENMVKLFKNALGRVIGEARSKQSLIEIRTFVSDAVSIVNDRPLTSVSSRPNDLLLVSPSSFLGQQLAPYTPILSYVVCGRLLLVLLFEISLLFYFKGAAMLQNRLREKKKFF